MRTFSTVDAPRYETIAERITNALRREFGGDAKIGAERGYGGRVRAQIVSPRFNPMTERQKQEHDWKILHDELGPDAIHVTFILAHGTDEEVVYPFD